MCDLKPVAGPAELRKAALKVVRTYWRFRPFLVDRKPAVVQFPVAVKFFPPQRQQTLWIAREPNRLSWVDRTQT